MSLHLPRFSRLLAAVLGALTLAAAGPARAWGAEGHHAIGAVAARLLEGTPTAAALRERLGGLTLAQAGVWADCARAVRASRGYRYEPDARHPECAVHETPHGRAAMADYVRRHDRHCVRRGEDDSCHKGFHHTDLALQRTGYRAGDPGTRPDDLLAAIGACLAVLQGGTASPPFALKDAHEALLLLVHLVGDLHQPLHVGALRLDAHGRPADADAANADTGTRGGNRLSIEPRHGAPTNLHALWDELPPSRSPQARHDALLPMARATWQQPPPRAPLAEWPAHWAADSLAAAREAHAGLQVQARRDDGRWPTRLPPGYRERMASLQHAQLAKAAAHLAQLLSALWP